MEGISANNHIKILNRMSEWFQHEPIQRDKNSPDAVKKQPIGTRHDTQEEQLTNSFLSSKGNTF